MGDVVVLCAGYEHPAVPVLGDVVLGGGAVSGEPYLHPYRSVPQVHGTDRVVGAVGQYYLARVRGRRPAHSVLHIS